MPTRWTTAFASAVAAACLLSAAPSAATAACGPAGYAYAGVQSQRNGHGISARVTSLATPVVAGGHVAGWVGVGAPGEGPGGSDSWIQTGLNSLPGTGNTLYYEVTRPYAGTQYVELARDVPSGQTLRLAVLEVAGMRDHWRVWVNGRAMSQPIRLVGSHTRLTPMAMAESWDGGRRVCNRYAYRFDAVSLATAQGGGWQIVRDTVALQDPGFRIERRSAGSFVAATAGMRTQRPQAASVRPKAAARVAPQVVTVQPVEEARSVPQRKGVLPAPAAKPVVAPAAKPSAPAPAAAVVPAAPAPVAPQAPATPVPVGPAVAVAVAGDEQGNAIELRLVSLLSAW